MNIGFLVDELKTDQFSFTLIQYCNSLCKQHSPIIFCRTIPKLYVNPSFATMNILEAYNYNGLLIATSLSTLETMSKCIGTYKKYYYIWNPEWSNPNCNFRYVYELLHSQKIEVIVRSKSYNNIVQNNFNLPSIISDNFDIGKILCQTK